MSELLEQGRLSNLAKIAREGTNGTLRALMPIASPPIWNSIVTGMPPSRHGILSFSHKDASGDHHLFLATDRRVPAIWSIASAHGLSVGVVNFWNTFPLEKINGVMISDHVLAREIKGRQRLTGAVDVPNGALIYPGDWNERIGALVREGANPVPSIENPFNEEKMLPRWVRRDELKRRFAEDGVLTQMALSIDEGIKPELLMVLLPGVDRISHYLWGVVEPEESYRKGLRPTPEGRAAGRAALHAYYDYVDALIGVLMAGFGPEDLVMVVSDHGFEAGQAMMRLTGVHDSEKAIDGIVFARGPGIAPGSRSVGMSVNDVTPTLLTYMRLPVARYVKGKSAKFLEVAPQPPVRGYPNLEIGFVSAGTISGVEEEIVEELRALGYLQED